MDATTSRDRLDDELDGTPRPANAPALSASGLATTAVANPDRGDEGDRTSFGGVWGDDARRRTAVVTAFAVEPDPGTTATALRRDDAATEPQR